MTQRELFLGALFPTALLLGQQNAAPLKTYNYSADHLSISIPADWVAIQRSELDQMSANVRRAAPNASPQPYNYGFQASPDARYPRVLIQVKTSGRWREKVFAQLPKASTGDLQRQVQSATPAFATLNLKVGKLTYDPSTRVAWLRTQFTGDDGETQGFSGLHPTNIGSIQVHCYALTPEFEQYAPLFSEIITSVKIDDVWKYRERSRFVVALGDFSDLASSAVTGAVGGLATVVVLWVFRKRRRAAKAAGPVV